MGVVKRIQGWRDSGWPIPNTLQALVGLIEPRDPEAFMEAKRSAHESAKERVAIQEERPAHPVSMTGEHPEMPVRAQPGWYRVNSTFYRNGQGPFADWSRPLSEPSRIPGMRQGLLF
jgi:hypothetical protein